MSRPDPARYNGKSEDVRLRGESPARRDPGEALQVAAQSPFGRRPRDQIRLYVSSSPSNRLPKMGAVKLGLSSLTER